MTGKRYKIGAILEAGGNKVFFVNGVLGVLSRENVDIDYLVGLSSSAPIIFAYLLKKNSSVARMFADTLDRNRKNFYLFRNTHFPHDEMYGSSIAEILNGYDREDIASDFLILATRTSAKLPRFKAICATLFLLLAFGLKIDLLELFRRVFHAEAVGVGKEDGLSREELIDFMMGSSTIYPFIGLHYVNGSLILEGALLALDYEELLSDCEKRIVVHTGRGLTGIAGDTLHIYSDEHIPNNILDYTDGSQVLSLDRLGGEVMLKHLPLLKRFIHTDHL